jgi:hypothetical protein
MSNEAAAKMPPVGDDEEFPQDDTIYYPNGGVPFKVVRNYDIFAGVTERISDSVDDDALEEDTEDEDDVDSQATTVKMDEEEPVATNCPFCGWDPCFMQTHYENLLVLGTELEDSQHYANHEIRFHLYREMVHLYYGSLGSGNRRQLPHCVVSEIHDAYPKCADTEYVGFQPKP